ncbi:hypothetical protein KRX19_02645 [Cardiobacteriaceae bacterium TAE3-ERU3]|nr:hypothetical protein [Cardiobacteriaceae bacterium TAE3-ERU3]
MLKKISYLIFIFIVCGILFCIYAYMTIKNSNLNNLEIILTGIFYLFIPYLLLKIISSLKSDICFKDKNIFFNPEKSFFELPIVINTGLTIILISLISSFIITINSKKIYIDFSYNGFNSFIEIYRFSLGILALLIPLVALLAANHRSEQTKKQIEVANSQNNFTNYFKHLEEFEKYIEKSDYKHEVNITKLHIEIFPQSKLGDFSIDYNIIELISQEIENNILHIKELIFEHNNQIEYIDSCTNEITSFFSIIGSNDKNIIFNEEDNFIYFSNKNREKISSKDFLYFYDEALEKYNIARNYRNHLSNTEEFNELINTIRTTYETLIFAEDNKKEKIIKELENKINKIELGNKVKNLFKKIHVIPIEIIIEIPGNLNNALKSIITDREVYINNDYMYESRLNRISSILNKYTAILEYLIYSYEFSDQYDIERIDNILIKHIGEKNRTGKSIYIHIERKLKK